MRVLALIAAIVVGATLAGCKTAPTATPGASTPVSAQTSSSGPTPAPNPVTKAAAAKGHLAIEKLRLAELFRGTPVLVALQPDGNLRVEVPLHFAFDAGKSAVKPALAAVLDRVATGQLHEATQIVVRAPPDASGKGAAMAGERAASVHDYLVSKGLADARVVAAGSAGAPVVRLVVSDAPLP